MSDIVEWRGPQDGLPPVGMKVECYRGGEVWERGKVVAHVEADDCRWYAIVQREDGWSFHPAKYTRPIQSDRDKALEEIEAVVKQAFCEQAYVGMRRAQILSVALYDAGYRKEAPPCSTK